MKRWPLLLAGLCLLLAAGCLKSKWPKNQDPEVERRVIDAFKEEADEADVGSITRSTRLSKFFEEEGELTSFLQDLANEFEVTLPAHPERGLRTVGDVIDLMGYLAAQQPKDGAASGR
jgi:hypothetical protein